MAGIPAVRHRMSKHLHTWPQRARSASPVRRSRRLVLPSLVALAGMLGANVPLVHAQGVGSPSAQAAPERANDAAWAALKAGGVAVLFRHAQAPGGGDPPGWRLGDCSTQRNLDDTGRAQSRRIGEAFRSRAIDVAGVHHSRWCRTRETAEGAFPGQAREAAEFDSFFGTPERESAQSTSAARQLGRWMDAAGAGRVVVVVTHQVNITALTGVVPVSGEGVVVRRRPGVLPHGLEVVARLSP